MNRKKGIGGLIFISAMLCCIGIVPVYGANVLIINSDVGIEKYNIVQEEFIESVDGLSLSKMDLSREGLSNYSIENQIYKLNPDIIYAIGTKAYMLSKRYADRKPIVFTSIINWLRLGLTPYSFGISNELHTGMQLMLFRMIFPKIDAIGLLYSKQYFSEWYRQAKIEANNVGIKIVGFPIKQTRHIVSDAESIMKDIDAFWLVSDPVVWSDTKILIGLLQTCEKNRKPVFSYHEALVKMGAVLVVSVDNPTVGRQAAEITETLLDGGKIDNQVQYPAGSHIILNMKKIIEYKMDYNEDALKYVNQIIE